MVPMSIQIWEHFFKPEVRSSGRSLVNQGKVLPTRLSDTEIQSYVRVSSAAKVILKSPSIDSKTVLANCTCPLSKKGQFCKHIWAALLVIEQKYPDFLEDKVELEQGSSPLAEKKSFSQEAYKLKQADYRKEQYQIQKQRIKDKKTSMKGSQRNSPSELKFPPGVELAIKYFSQNGFDLKSSLNAENIGFAKKKLSRVFHPDVGGSHEEIQELNKFAEVLIKYAKN